MNCQTTTDNAAKRTPAEVAALLERYMPLARKLARGARDIEPAAAFSIAMDGLLEAIRKSDAHIRVRFIRRIIARRLCDEWRRLRGRKPLRITQYFSSNILRELTTVSLESDAGDDRTLGDVTPDAHAAPDADLIGREDQAALIAALQDLPERPRRIVAMRFGLFDYEPMTLDQIGAVFAITGARVQQIVAAALPEIRRVMEREA